MVQSGWDVVCDYYQNIDVKPWVPYSVMKETPLVAKNSKTVGEYGTTDFALNIVNVDKHIISPWHDISLFPAGASDSTNVVNFVIEIPMYSTAKMEMCKECDRNEIKQDIKDSRPRFYTYGTPFFNYGFLPQTYENPKHQDPETKAYGDNDPIDVIELGDGVLPMGTVGHGKVLGALELIDEGETDHKILILNSNDPHYESINDIHDLEYYKPGTIAKCVDWLTNYKTTEGKGVNTLTHTTPTSVRDAMGLVAQVHDFYRDLINGLIDIEDNFFLPAIKV